MFKCEICNKIIGPGVKAIKVVELVRPASYHNTYTVEDEWGNKQDRAVDSTGSEIVRELMVCAADAEAVYGIPEQKRGNSTIVMGGNGFQEKLAEPLPCKVIAVVVHNALERVDHVSDRAEADSKIAVPLVKHFVDTNPKFII